MTCNASYRCEHLWTWIRPSAWPSMKGPETRSKPDSDETAIGYARVCKIDKRQEAQIEATRAGGRSAGAVRALDRLARNLAPDSCRARNCLPPSPKGHGGGRGCDAPSGHLTIHAYSTVGELEPPRSRDCAMAALAKHQELPEGNARSASRAPCLDSPLAVLGQVSRGCHRARRRLSESATLNPASASAANAISHLADSSVCVRSCGPLSGATRRRLSRAIRIDVRGDVQSGQARGAAAKPSAYTARTDRAVRARLPSARPPRRTAIRACSGRERASIDARSADLASCSQNATACAMSPSAATVLESSANSDSTAEPKTVLQPVARVGSPSAHLIRVRPVHRCDALHGPPPAQGFHAHLGSEAFCNRPSLRPVGGTQPRGSPP